MPTRTPRDEATRSLFHAHQPTHKKKFFVGGSSVFYPHCFRKGNYLPATKTYIMPRILVWQLAERQRGGFFFFNPCNAFEGISPPISLILHSKSSRFSFLRQFLGKGGSEHTTPFNVLVPKAAFRFWGDSGSYGDNRWIPVFFFFFIVPFISLQNHSISQCFVCVGSFQMAVRFLCTCANPFHPPSLPSCWT
ncbi:hypothetical protein FKM82_007738 [Ascaphus truei]